MGLGIHDGFVEVVLRPRRRSGCAVRLEPVVGNEVPAWCRFDHLAPDIELQRRTVIRPFGRLLGARGFVRRRNTDVRREVACVGWPNAGLVSVTPDERFGLGREDPRRFG